MRDEPKKKKIRKEESEAKKVDIVNPDLEPEPDEEMPGVGYEILSIGKND